jgi:hypothetical protein
VLSGGQQNVGFQAISRSVSTMALSGLRLTHPFLTGATHRLRKRICSRRKSGIDTRRRCAGEEAVVIPQGLLERSGTEQNCGEEEGTNH